MLIGIDPILNADILYTLRAMGHGDEIVLVDANFPAETMAQRLIRMECVDAPTLLSKILTVLPIDEFVPEPVLRMEVVDDPDAVPDVVGLMQKEVDKVTGGGLAIGKIDRFDFYDRTRECFAIVATGERRLYGNIIIKKGVLRPGH